MTGSGSRGRYRLGLAALMLMAGLHHFATLDAGLPHKPARDEHAYIWHLDLFRESAARRASDPAYGFYPHLISRAAACLPFWTAGPFRGVAPQTPEQHRRLASLDFLRVRAVVALLSLLVIPATWLVARELVSPRAAFLSSTLVAGSLFFGLFAVQARPHAPFAALAWLALALAIAAGRLGGAGRWLLAGAGTGLALATLQSGLFLFPPLWVAHFGRSREARRGEFRWLAAALLLALVVALPFYPFLFHSTAPYGGPPPAGAIHVSGHNLWLGDFGGNGFPILLRALWDFEPIPTSIALLGSLLGIAAVATGLRRRGQGTEPRTPRALWVVLAFVLPYFVVFGLYDRTFDRFVIPMIPMVAIVAAWAVDRASRSLDPSGRGLFPAAALTVGAATLFLAARLTRLQVLPDTAERAAAFLVAHADRTEDRIAVMRSLELPILRQGESPPGEGIRIGFDRSPWRVYQARVDPATRARDGWSVVDLPLGNDALRKRAFEDPEGYVRDLGVKFIVIEVRDSPLVRALRAWLLENVELAARFAPSDSPENAPSSAGRDPSGPSGMETRGPLWAAWMLGLRRFGTVVEIYSVDRGGAIHRRGEERR